MRDHDGITTEGSIDGTADGVATITHAGAITDAFSASGGVSFTAPFAGTGRTIALRPRGRHRECAALDHLIAALWVGEARALVIRGQKGSGKSTLLDYLADQATGCIVLRVDAVSAEKDLKFAALHQLCAPVLARAGGLPEPQREALDHVFGVRNDGAPSSVVVGMAIQGLLGVVAAGQPVLCIVNDAHWLDAASAQALGFAARRLPTAPVAIVLAARHDDGGHLAGLPELKLGGLTEADTQALLSEELVGPVGRSVRGRMAAEAHGNPLAVELAAHESPEHLAGGYGLPLPAVAGDLEATFVRRVIQLPAATRRMLLLAAADPTGDAILLWAAALHLGLGPDDAQPAISSGLVELDAPVRFCHPLVRSVIYRLASAQERRDTHRALAVATDPKADPARRAWHLGHAAAGVDEATAAALEQTATAAGAQGGMAAIAAFHARAVELTADPGTRARRALLAAEAKWWSGASPAARRLLALAQAGPLDTRTAARAAVLYALLAPPAETGADRAMLLIDAAERVGPEHPPLAVRALCAAFNAAFVAGRLANTGVTATALAVRTAAISHDSSGCAALVGAAAILASDGPQAGAQAVKAALATVPDGTEDDLDAGALRLAHRLAQAIWDDRAWAQAATQLTDTARHRGALAVMPRALHTLAVVALLASGTDTAARLAAEADTVANAVTADVLPYGRLAVAAWSGQALVTAHVIAEVTPTAVAVGEGEWLTAADWALAVLNNGAGRYSDALKAAESGSMHAEEFGFGMWSWAELVEAAVRSGEPQRAIHALNRLTTCADATGANWVSGVAARCRALLADGHQAEVLYRTAIESLSHTCVRADLARAHLLFGEWLRREGRRSEAREHLMAAHDAFVDYGYGAFLERARRELAATGASPRKRSSHATEALTPQETQIARLARAGRTNSDIAVELFISPRTVEWHLRNVYIKLGIESRRDLASVLPS